MPTSAASLQITGSAGTSLSVDAGSVSFAGSLSVSGLVGIGTTSPISALDVRGIIRASQIVRGTPVAGSSITFGAVTANNLLPPPTFHNGTGALTSVGTTATGTNPRWVAVDPTGRFAYVTNYGSTTVQTYTINQSTGALTSVGTAATGTNPIGVAVDPTGRFAYVANFGSNTVQAYTINQSTGVLTSVGTTATGTNPFYAAVDPTGRFVFAVNNASNTVQAYTINQSTGALTSVGTTATGTTPYECDVDPTGRFVFLTNSGGNTVQAYTINQSTGALTSVGTTATGTNPVDVAVDPTGRFAYVVNSVSNTVQAYTINQSTGGLTSVGTTATGTTPLAVAVDPTGRFAYVANFGGGNTVQAYTINQSTGALTSVGTTATGSSPVAPVVDPTGRFVYVANYNGATVQAYRINNFAANSGTFQDQLTTALIDGGSATSGTTDTVGSNLTIAAGASTGSGTPGDIVFQTAPAGSSGSTVNARVERMRLTGAGVLNFSNTDVTLDKTITAQTVTYDTATSFGMSGGQGSYTISHTTGIGSNRLLVVSFVGNESGAVGSMTYPRGGVATNLTLLGTLTGYPVQSLWYLTNPDSGANNVVITMSTQSYCGFGITTWANVNQTTPMASYQTTSGTSVSGAISITVPTATNNMLVSSLITYNKSNTPSANQTGVWSATADASWKAYGYRATGVSGSIVLTQTLSGSTTTAWSYTGATIQNASSASPVLMSTTASALNLSLGAASSWTLATATPALNIASSLLTFDTANARIGIGTTTPGYKLTLSADSAAKPTSNTWTISSDGRIKNVLHPYAKGLEEVTCLNPMVYRLNGLYGSQDDGKNHVSVIAQDIAESWPAMIGTYIHEETLEDQTIQRTELYNLNTNELQWALVNAVKELSARVKVLEAKLAAK